MLVICGLYLAINAGGIPVISKVDVEGKVIKKTDIKYLVNFSKGVLKYDIVGKPEDYKKVLVNKTECVGE